MSGAGWVRLDNGRPGSSCHARTGWRADRAKLLCWTARHEPLQVDFLTKRDAVFWPGTRESSRKWDENGRITAFGRNLL
jgi:hypothetical protein